MDSLSDLQRQLHHAGYVANDEIVQALRAALVLDRPLLVEGPPGVGKTVIAHALSRLLDAPLIRIQCYEGIGAEQLLYDYNHAKQLLFISLLREQVQQHLQGHSLAGAIRELDREAGAFWGREFLLRRPLLEAIDPPDGRRRVLLIDEVDKTEADAEALLLEVLSEYSVSIPEFGTIQASSRPVVVLTGNRSRELGEALRRRCLYLYLDYPDRRTEAAILALHVPEADPDYRERVVDAVQRLRQLKLRQPPAVAEAIDALRLLVAAHGDSWLHALAKHPEDRDAIRRAGIDLS